MLVCGAEPEEIVDGLRGALLTYDELSRPSEWSAYADPFGADVAGAREGDGP